MSESKPIQVLLVDDHAMVRSGLSAFLLAFDDLELIGEASSGEEACDMCRTCHPNVILMDLVMPGMGGIAATADIRECYPEVQVIALTSFAEQEQVQAALRAGAVSYLMKNVTAEELAKAIRDAAIGKSNLSPEAARALIQTTKETPPQEYDLTKTENSVLKLMIDGLSNPEIAEQMVVSPSTVKFHVSNILSKLGVASRTEAVALAVRYNLVE